MSRALLNELEEGIPNGFEPSPLCRTAELRRARGNRGLGRGGVGDWNVRRSGDLTAEVLAQRSRNPAEREDEKPANARELTRMQKEAPRIRLEEKMTADSTRRRFALPRQGKPRFFWIGGEGPRIGFGKCPIPVGGSVANPQFLTVIVRYSAKYEQSAGGRP